MVGATLLWARACGHLRVGRCRAVPRLRLAHPARPCLPAARVQNPEAQDGKPYSSRYIGSLVGDFHRTMLYGGIYGYPGDTKNKTGVFAGMVAMA